MLSNRKERLLIGGMGREEQHHLGIQLIRLENGQVTGTSYLKQNKKMVEQIDPMDRGHCQPGNCGHRRPGISGHDPFAWNIRMNEASQYGDYQIQDAGTV